MDAKKGPKRCPDCGGENLVPEGRCVTCADCGWSACNV